ncbi:MAG: CHRD domain-containing protein [Gemmatimonadota bacterium]|nr:CHRD domain-containing protein [Gemmatimonadota bacterium]
MRSILRLGFGGLAVALLMGCADRDPVSPVSEVSTAFSRGADVTTTAMHAAPQRNFVAVLSSADAGTDSKSRGVAKFQLSLDGTEVSYRLNVANIDNLLMAHIHLAPAGQNGPIAVWLYPDGPPPQLITGRFSGVLATGTITDADLVGPLADMTIADLVQQLEAEMGYVNVHTLQHPPGEIRGQISIPRGR